MPPRKMQSRMNPIRKKAETGMDSEGVLSSFQLCCCAFMSGTLVSISLFSLVLLGPEFKEIVGFQINLQITLVCEFAPAPPLRGTLAGLLRP